MTCSEFSKDKIYKIFSVAPSDMEASHPIHFACLSGDLDLLKNKKDISNNLSDLFNKKCTDQFQYTPLAIALISMNYDVVEWLLKNGVNPNTPFGEKDYQCLDYLLHYKSILEELDIKLIKLLFRYGARISDNICKDEAADNIMNIANVDVVKLFLEAGYELKEENIFVDGYTLESLLVHCNSPEFVKFIFSHLDKQYEGELVNKILNPDYGDWVEGNSILHTACENKLHEFIEFFASQHKCQLQFAKWYDLTYLVKSCGVNLYDYEFEDKVVGISPLAIACFNGDVKALRIIESQLGAQFNSILKKDSNIMLGAFLSRNIELVEYLKNKGAVIDGSKFYLWMSFVIFLETNSFEKLSEIVKACEKKNWGDLWRDISEYCPSLGTSADEFLEELAIMLAEVGYPICKWRDANGGNPLHKFFIPDKYGQKVDFKYFTRLLDCDPSQMNMPDNDGITPFNYFLQELDNSIRPPNCKNSEFKHSLIRGNFLFKHLLKHNTDVIGALKWAFEHKYAYALHAVLCRFNTPKKGSDISEIDIEGFLAKVSNTSSIFNADKTIKANKFFIKCLIANYEESELHASKLGRMIVKDDGGALKLARICSYYTNTSKLAGELIEFIFSFLTLKDLVAIGTRGEQISNSTNEFIDIIFDEDIEMIGVVDEEGV